ncbi:hypothetical protein [Sandaracinus amylolyticus]|uniref:hypothetical protein n=1 Tax=Sandaracinus amylolyticus TaxID=927083 RepID=UPI001F1B0D5A|nr:hypothetical protein [Sandaracinus amylolyticus]UJR86624.1 Hypothetical protein I5071_87250 [Sandaracinus amylolyticus]
MRRALFALIVILSGCSSAEDRLLVDPEGRLEFDAAMIGFDAGTRPIEEIDAQVDELDGGVPEDAPIVRRDAAGDASTEPPLTGGSPDVPRDHVGSTAWNGLTVLQHAISQIFIEEVFLIVRNDHPTTAFCSVRFTLSLRDAGGGVVQTHQGTFTSQPRLLHSADTDCIPPGEIGLGYANGFSFTDLSRVARIAYSFDGSIATAGELSTFVVVADEGQRIVDEGLGLTVQGTLRVLSGGLRDPRVQVFPFTTAGFPFTSLGGSRTGTFLAGSTSSYSSSSTSRNFDHYLVAHTYRSASSPLVVDSPEARAALEARAAFDALTAEIQARRAR